MQDAGKKYCPSCAAEVPALSMVCGHCGSSLRSMTVARPRPKPKACCYEIVNNAQGFGIALGGEVLITGLSGTDLEKAKSVVAILNKFIKDLRTG